MRKDKKVWYCRECGHKESKWVGQCSTCSQWNSFDEAAEEIQEEQRFTFQKREGGNRALPLKNHTYTESVRYPTTLPEFDRLLGGGLVKGSLTLVGGDPGIGKSTLLLQAAHLLAKQGITTLYVSGEESFDQTYLRAQRLGVDSERLFVLAETNFSVIKKNIEEVKPSVVIVDSIQIVYKNDIPAAPGSIVQVRELAMEFMHLAKGRDISILLIGHVTKAGEIAGPKVLEHLVDTVLYFEGEKQQNFRLLKVVKNRFGSTDEVAVFQMTQSGLLEVNNPSQFFLEERSKEKSGSIIVATLEGSRSFLVEVQALVTDTIFSTPSRRASGIDSTRLALLLAVLEKRAGFMLHNRDVFVSLAGGIRVNETAIDLGVLLAVLSSYTNKVVPSDMVAVGEVGLAGEIRSVPRLEGRLKEAIHLGFKRFFVPKKNIESISPEISSKVQLHPIQGVEEAIGVLLG